MDLDEIFQEPPFPLRMRASLEARFGENRLREPSLGVCYYACYTHMYGMAVCAYAVRTAGKTSAPLHAVFFDDVVDHQRARLAHDRRLHPGAALDCAHHRAVSSPLLNAIRAQSTPEPENGRGSINGHIQRKM